MLHVLFFFLAKSLYLYLELTGMQLVVFSHSGVSMKGRDNTENPMSELANITVPVFT